MKVSTTVYRLRCAKMFRISGAVMVLTFMLLIGIGCGAKQPVLKFQVKSDETVNNGQPVYIVIRTVTPSDFVSQDYQSVASMVMQNPPDKTVVFTQLILPDRKIKFKVNKPDNQSLAVYCMFTEPDPAQWKVFLQKPLEKKYKFILEENNLLLK